MYKWADEFSRKIEEKIRRNTGKQNSTPKTPDSYHPTIAPGAEEGPCLNDIEESMFDLVSEIVFQEFGGKYSVYHNIHLNNEHRTEADILVAEARLVVEVDGIKYHTDSADKNRDRDLKTNLGITTFRIKVDHQQNLRGKAWKRKVENLKVQIRGHLSQLEPLAEIEDLPAVAQQA